jgi:membrane protein DedA with SNARE-associated domain
MNLTALLIIYKYPLLFAGTFLLGEVLFVPAAFLVQSGTFTLFGLMLATNLANCIADLAWYGLVQFVPLEKIKRWGLVKDRQETVEKISVALDKYGYGLLFISKFLYGTRISVIVACALKKFNIGLYLLVSAFGTFVYLWVLYLLATTVQTIHSITKYKIVALIIFVCFIALYIWIHRLIKRRLL